MVLAVLAEGVLTRACMRDPVLRVLFFAVTSVTVDGVENLFHPKNDGLFYAK